MSKALLDDLFDREIKRLDDLSRKEPLDLEDLRRLDLLVKAIKSYQIPDRAPNSPFADVSSDDLVKFLKDSAHAKKEKGRAGKAANFRDEALGDAVEAGTEPGPEA